MWLIQYETDEYEVVIDTSTRQMLLELKLNDERIVRLSDTFKSFSYMSECLRDYADMGFAVEALEANAVPHDHPLWTLGFKGGETYWRQY